MGRVLPSGRVFGEAVALPQIGFAKKEPFGGRIQEVVESPLTNMAVAGISRIKDELDYQDRLQAEKSRVAGAQIAERKAEAALKALQEQQAARTAALAAAEEREARIAAEGEAMMRAAEQADRAEYQQGLALGAMQDAVDRIVGGSPRAAAQSEAALSAMGDVAGAVGAGRRGARLPQQSEFARAMAALNEDPVAFEVAMRARERAAAAPPTQEQQFLAGLAQAEDPVAYEAAWRAAQQQGGYDPSVAGRPGDWRITPPLVMDDPAPPIPEEVTAEQLAEAQAALEAAQKAAAVPMQFVPKTIADFRFKVRDLETRLLQAETAEEKQSLANQIRQTISQARGAVDVQPEDLMEAITKEAGKEAQKTAYDEMTITEKEFLRQMYEASKEKRAVAAEKRDESREARAQEKHDDWKKSADRKLRALSASKRIRAEDRPIMNNLAVFIQDDDDYRSKAGKYSDEAIQAEWMSVPRSGPLSPEGIEQARQNKWASRVGPLAGSTMDTLEIGLQSAGISRRGMKAAQKSLGAGRKTATYRAKRRDALAKEQRERSKRMGLTEGQRTMETKAIGNIAALEAYDNAIAANKEDIDGAERKAAMAGAKAELDHINQMRGGQTLQSQPLQSQPLQSQPLQSQPLQPPITWNKESMKAFADRYGAKRDL